MTAKMQAPQWVDLTDHAVIVQTCHGTTGKMIFEGACPHLVGDYREVFVNSLRNDVSACKVEPAKPVFRPVVSDGMAPAPETCTPYVDANALGYCLLNLLPLVFVRTLKGEVLPNARVAVKYMRENARRFSSILDELAHYAPRIFDPGKYSQLERSHPLLARDVAQPYSAFSNAHMAMGAGCYVKTPPGIATILGPPVNQVRQLRLHSGLMESEWHRSELFIVFDYPEIEGQVLLVAPDTPIAQFFFVTLGLEANCELLFSQSDLGAETRYRQRSIEVGLDMVEKNKAFVLSKTTGTKSLSVSCPHCWVSITAAAEGGVPEDHVQVQDFYAGYKQLRREYRQSELAESSSLRD